MPGQRACQYKSNLSEYKAEHTLIGSNSRHAHLNVDPFIPHSILGMMLYNVFNIVGAGGVIKKIVPLWY